MATVPLKFQAADPYSKLPLRRIPGGTTVRVTAELVTDPAELLTTTS